MPTFGNTDIIQDQSGNALANVPIQVYGSLSDAQNKTNLLGTSTTNNKGQWPITVNGMDQVWARDPAGNIWTVASDTVAADHAARLSALEGLTGTDGSLYAPIAGSPNYAPASGSTVYETQTHAASTYAPAMGSATYETQAHAASTYAPATGSGVYETQAHASSTYQTQAGFDTAQAGNVNASGSATDVALKGIYDSGIGQIVYVSTTGNDSHNGKTWGTAKATLPAALAGLGGGAGTVYAGPGTFTISSADASGNGLTLTHQGQKIIGGGANQTTILINTNVTWGVQLQAQFCQLSGVYVSIASGKTATYGVGVSTPASTGSAEFCRFTDVFVNCSGTVTAAFALGPDWPGSSNVDVADTILDGCCFNGAPTHGYLFGNGTSGNVLMHHMFSCGGAGASYGLTASGSGFTWHGGGFSNNTISDIHITQGCTDTVTLSGLRFENGKRFLDVGYIGGITGGVNLIDCMVANYTPADNKIIEYDSYSPLNIIGGYYEAGASTLISVNSSGGTPAVPFTAIGVELVNQNGWPAKNLARVVRTILNASYNNAGVSTPNPSFAAVLDGQLGVVSTAPETAVTSATTLTSSALGTAIKCTPNTAFTLTLPTPVGVAGQQISVRVDDSSLQLLTLATAAGNIDGQATRIMWKGESATLLSDGTNWVKIAGRTLPMSASFLSQNTIAVASATFTTLALTSTSRDNTGLMVSGSTITIQRPGLYTVQSRVGMAAAPAAASRCILTAQKNGTTAVVQNETSSASGTNLTFVATDQITLAASDTLIMQFYQNSGSSWSTVASAVANGSAMTVTEIPSW